VTAGDIAALPAGPLGTTPEHATARAAHPWVTLPTADGMELLVSHRRGHFGKARREVLRVLRRLGDEHSVVERTGVDGIALVHTGLDVRDVVRGCRNLLLEGCPFEHAIKWVPVDYWCERDLEAIRRLLADKIRDQIAPDETWGMKVEKRGWQGYRTRDIVIHLARAIDRKVDLAHPDRLVRVDAVGGQVAVSVLRPDDVFSIAAFERLASAPALRDAQPHQADSDQLPTVDSPAS
jgi:tRNA(Ser,Leu) C12 N-acetylase TAN1